jgi:hypothetical protein
LFCASGLVFGDAEGVWSRFHVLCSRTRFQRYRGRRVPFLCFVLLDSFSAVQRASGPVFLFVLSESASAVLRASGSDFMFCAPGHVFGGAECVGFRFNFLCSPDSFSAVPSVSGSVFMFCAPRLVFGGAEGVGFRFHVLCSQTHFRRYRGRRVPFSCFVLPNSFSSVPKASGPVFMFCAPGFVSDGTEGVGSRFNV